MSYVELELPPFAYASIPPGSIRLLVPDPIGKCGGHTWTLQIASINEVDVHFDAPTYAWGPQTNFFPITLDGRLSHVHHNLHSALPYLAQRSKLKTKQPIWIDAICINQNDDKENMTQTSLMDKIYRKAERV